MAARHLSAKQIRAGFGGKRRRSALKTKRHNPRAAKRTAPKRRRASTRRKPARRKNVGEVVSILLPGLAGNPARKKGRKTMAATKRHRRRATAQRNAGTRRRRHVVRAVRHHRRRGNPGQVKGYLVAGASVIAGAVLSKTATQMVLGTKNASWIGYGGNVVATGLLGALAHAMFRDKMISSMVIAGGVAQVLVRVIGDQTPYGSYLTGAGVGDYQVSNFLAPQRMTNALRSAALDQPWLAPPAAVVVTHPATAAGVGWAPDWN